MTPVVARIEAALAQLVEPIALVETESPALYRRLEREATALLHSFVRRGEVSAFHVRCSAETSADADGPVVEVVVREPRRVQALVLRFNAF